MSLFFVCFSLNAIAIEKGNKAKNKRVTCPWIVVAIRPVNKGDDFARVTFLRSARFYKLPVNADPTWMQLLQESQKSHKPVMVSREKEESDVITGVAKLK